MTMETAFSVDVSSIKYGAGVTSEIGCDMKALGASRVMVVTDHNLAQSEPVSLTVEALRKEGIDAVLFDRARVEPTDGSLKEAIRFADEGKFDGFVGVGGGSSIDTAKAANLYTSYPADFLDYVNMPIGRSKPVPGSLKPMIAVPTTAGTGAEASGVIVFHLEERHAKTGISHRAVRPIMGIIDPNNTRTVPRLVAASCGLDLMCHALESLTALPYNQREAPEHPALRPSHQGANPISHVWASKALEMVSESLPRVLADTNDDEARGQMMLASAYAGIGFANAGTHLAHAMSYPVSGMVRDYQPEGYVSDYPIIPHGISVALNAPAVFIFTGPSNPELHLYAARLMGADTSGATPKDAGAVVAERLASFMRASGLPNGLTAVGYGPDDAEALVAGTLPQHRLTKLSPRPASADDLKQLFLDSFVCW